MKNILYTAIVGMCVFLTGCFTPTVEQMSNLGTVSGTTAAYVLNEQVKPDDATRNGIVDVMNEVRKYVPATNETYTAKWIPIAKEYLESLEKDGQKLPVETIERVVKDLSYLTSLLDAYIEKKGILEYKELTDAFVNSFIDSFLVKFKPANTMSSAADVEFDKFTEKFLLKAINK